MAGVPGIALTIGSGVVYGPVGGTLLSLLGVTSGALAAFGLARYVLPERALQRARRDAAMARFERAVRHMPLRFTIGIRFLPLVPFNLANYLFGLTPIHWITYTLGTVLGILPGTIAGSWLGATGERALQGGKLWPFGLALSLLAAIALLPVLLPMRQGTHRGSHRR